MLARQEPSLSFQEAEAALGIAAGANPALQRDRLADRFRAPRLLNRDLFHRSVFRWPYATIASASISIYASASISRATSTIVVAGRMSSNTLP